MYTIEKNVPIISKGSLLESMEVGDSILIPASESNTFSTYASSLKIKLWKHFMIKKVDDKTKRLWRLK